MFTLSLAMIVKNEETTIERVLNCAKAFCDEIIIVDTGSSDSTIDKCNKYTKNIFHFKWCDDFSKARNFAFSKATKDYIIWLDADDYIDNENISKIIELKKGDKNPDMFMLKYVMGFKNNISTFEFYRERIIKNNKTFMWEGFIHEAIALTKNIIYTDIQIEHRKEKENPPKRNLKIFRKQLKTGRTFSAREQYYYSRELYFNDYYCKAITQFKKFLNMENKYTPNIIDAYLIISKCYLKLNQNKKALDNIFTCIKEYIPTPEICCLVAEIYESIRKINHSILWYNLAIISPLPESGFVQKDYSDFIPYCELCKIYYKFNYAKSKEYFNLARDIKPNDPVIEYNTKFFIN